MQRINEYRDAKAQRIIPYYAPLCLSVEIKFFAGGEKPFYDTATLYPFYMKFKCTLLIIFFSSVSYSELTKNYESNAKTKNITVEKINFIEPVA